MRRAQNYKWSVVAAIDRLVLFFHPILFILGWLSARLGLLPGDIICWLVCAAPSDNDIVSVCQTWGGSGGFWWQSCHQGWPQYLHCGHHWAGCGYHSICYTQLNLWTLTTDYNEGFNEENQQNCRKFENNLFHILIKHSSSLLLFFLF